MPNQCTLFLVPTCVQLMPSLLWSLRGSGETGVSLLVCFYNWERKLVYFSHQAFLLSWAEFNRQPLLCWHQIGCFMMALCCKSGSVLRHPTHLFQGQAPLRSLTNTLLRAFLFPSNGAVAASASPAFSVLLHILPAQLAPPDQLNMLTHRCGSITLLHHQPQH